MIKFLKFSSNERFEVILRYENSFEFLEILLKIYSNFYFSYVSDFKLFIQTINHLID